MDCPHCGQAVNEFAERCARCQSPLRPLGKNETRPSMRSSQSAASTVLMAVLVAFGVLFAMGVLLAGSCLVLFTF